MTAAPAAVVADLTQAEAKILTRFATAGETLAEIAEHVEVPKDEVIRVVERIASNNRSYARTLALAWQHRDPQRAVIKPTTGAPPKPADTIADLLDRAAATDIPRLVRLADKVQDLVDQLGEQLSEHEKSAALRAEAEQLEGRLAEIKQQLGGKRTAAVPPAEAKVDSKAVRAWALDNGIDCSVVGRVPAAVVAAYEQREAQA